MEPLANGVEVKVSPQVSDAHVGMALESRVFREWKDSLDPRFKVSAVTFQAVDFKGRPSVENTLFERFKVKDNKPFEEIVELRGGTVVLLPIFVCEGRKYTVFVKQPRIATGDFEFVELPAGMVDGGTFKGAAAIELEEELGVRYEEDELVDMTATLEGPGEAIYFSPGLLDERAKFYTAEREIAREKLEEFEGKATGFLEEGEQITLWVVPYEQASFSTRDGKTFIALYLYEQMLRNA